MLVVRLLYVSFEITVFKLIDLTNLLHYNNKTKSKFNI